MIRHALSEGWLLLRQRGLISLVLALALAVGALALGSGSDFAHTIGVKPDLEEACQQVAHGQARPIDLGRVSVDGGEPHRPRYRASRNG